MRQTPFIGLAFAMMTASAWAADMPRKAPAAVAQPTATSGWTGCYIGAHVGSGWGSNELTSPAGFPLSDGSLLFSGTGLSIDQAESGLLYGGQAGCNYQFGNNWVVGFKGDFSGTKFVGNRELALAGFDPIFDPRAAFPVDLQVKTEWIAGATALVGYSFDRLLIYARGGAAWTHNRYLIAMAAINQNFPPQTLVAATDFTASETRTGWTVGAGFEYPLPNNFSATLEYNYYDFGSRAVQFVDQLATVPATGTLESKQHLHAIKFGLNYYFWNAPTQVGSTASPSITWNETFNSEVRYFSWRSTRGVPTNALASGDVAGPVQGPGRGTEIYTPYAAQLGGQSENYKVQLTARGGWVRATQSTAGLTGTISTATDTQMSGTFTYLGLNGVQPFASLDLNLPTGRTALTPDEVNARMDPDLVDIGSFGAGLNVGPTVGFNLPITDSLIFTASVGYTEMGGYDAEAPLTAPTHASVGGSHIRPGNETTVTSAIGYQSDAWSGKLTGTISQDAATTIDGAPFVRPGRRYLVSGISAYNWPGTNFGTTTLNASVTHSNRNDVTYQCLLPGCPVGLVTEPFNTNSNLYRVSVDHMVKWDKYAVGPTGSFLYRDNNAYIPTTVQFVPAKERWSAGLLAQYAPDKVFSFNARVERVWTHENTAPGLPFGQMFSVLANSSVTAFTVPVVSSTGWQFVVGLTASL
jgi:opacity protein-like surface antigen